MKRYNRLDLSGREVGYLKKRQGDLAAKCMVVPVQERLVERHWASSRQTKTLGGVFEKLKSLTGEFERCMYCMDSHGCDIDHFIPKSLHYTLTYAWENMLLCCTECGRQKGSNFPVDGHGPLLVNPMYENPWQFLDFDPELGIITAAYRLALGDYDPKGVETVKALGLDKREVLQAIYKRAYRRLTTAISEIIEADLGAEYAVDRLAGEDDCGLAGWCFSKIASEIEPMSILRVARPEVWDACVEKFH